MTVGEIIALLARYASNTDVYLMGTNVYSIDATDDGVIVYPVNGSSWPITIANVWGDEDETD